MANKLKTLAKTITQCERCPRLRKHCLRVAQIKRKSYADDTYWGRPVPGYGDPKAKLILVGLAPAAHGANRTGRIFTGDRSGDWLYRALHDAGYANQPHSISIQDGLTLKNAYVTCAVRCAPPDNKPSPKELKACAPFLHTELDLLNHAHVYIALGAVALGALTHYFKSKGDLLHSKKPKFAHGAKYSIPSGKIILCSFHPSQQNTFTGRLTQKMFDQVFKEATKELRLHG